jgi:c-di-GMP-binding flagellar brake protein YcgR
VAKEPQPVPAALIDVSASGLYVEVRDGELNTILKKQQNIEVELDFNSSRLRTPARVARRFEDKTSCYYGLQFSQLEDAALSKLYSFLYHKEITAEEEIGNEASFDAAPAEGLNI